MRVLLRWLAVALAGVVWAQQAPFELPEEPLVDTQDVRVLRHPSLPAHTLRLRRVPQGICERSEVASWSGYLDVDLDALYYHENGPPDGKTRPPPGIVEHFYFWAFESRHNQFADPVTLWLNGGPGCSSMTGLLMELGPCKAVQPENGHPRTAWNPYSWNANASVIFLDQPTGTGFSYTSWKNTSREDAPPSRIFNAEHAARDVSAFLHLLGTDSANRLIQTNTMRGSPVPQFTDFHLAGESYGGRYLPLLARQLLLDNERIVANPQSGLLPIPLASVLIGNGITSPLHQTKAYAEFACTNATGHGPFLPRHTCDKMWDRWPKCATMLQQCMSKQLDAHASREACVNANSFCSGALEEPWEKTNTSFYDYQHAPTYAEDQWVADFLNDPQTRNAIGIDPHGAGDSHNGTFAGCSDRVFGDFESTGDGARDTTWAVREVLSQGVRVLSYSGTRDFICNYLGNAHWTYDLPWAGGDAFRQAPLLPWYVEDAVQPAGHFRHYANLTYATLEGAGHFAPHDQPKAAQALFQRWVHGHGRLDA